MFSLGIYPRALFPLGLLMCPRAIGVTYMQIQTHKLCPTEFENKPFEYPAFSTPTFVRVMKVLDMSCLDIRSCQFGSSVLAASAFYIMTGKSETLLKHITPVMLL